MNPIRGVVTTQLLQNRLKTRSWALQSFRAVGQREFLIVACTLAVLHLVYSWSNLCYLPNERESVGGDYSLWLPDLLTRFPIGALHPGPALAVSAGNLNLKNPACYVFPHANACAPGDPFPATRLADAQAFLDYRPFPCAKPFWARCAARHRVLEILQSPA